MPVEQTQSNVEAMERVAGMLRGYFVAQGIYVAVRLRIADLIGEGGEMGIEELARATGSQLDGLYRMMRALASEGVFEERAGRRFGMTGLAEVLRSEGEGSMRAAALIAGDTQYKVWTLFKDAVKNGVPGFERIFRQPLFEFLGEHADVYALFNEAMTQRVSPVVEEVAGLVEAEAGETVVDVGGGHGRMLVAILERHAGVRGALLDAGQVIEEARGVIAGDVAERVEFVAGDFMKGVPRGDVMILGSILHMFQDGDAGHLLRNCRAGLGKGGRIYLVERILKGANERDAGKWEDLNMMMMTGGRERTLGEFEGLLEGAGFAGVDRISEMVILGRV